MSDNQASETLAAYGVPTVTEVQQHPSLRANGVPRLLPCRYDATHGTYPDPKSLGDHYLAEHPEHVTTNSTTVECTICHRRFLHNGTPMHMRASHADHPGAVGAPYTYVRVVARTNTPRAQAVRRKPHPNALGGPEGARRCELCGHTYKSKASARKHMQDKHPGQRWEEVTHRLDVEPSEGLEVRQPRRQRPQQRVADAQAPPPTIDAAYIVHTVVGALMHPEGTVPVAHLEAIFQWREATATMLAALTPER